MYRGRPPPRGGYPSPFEGRGPPPPRPYLAPGYRDDRSRPRPPYHPEYLDHVHSDSSRHSPPRKRYPSPGSGSHRSGEYWAGGPPRERSPSPRGPIPLDHNLIITVGNELTGPSGSVPSRHRDRDFPPRLNYEPTRSRDRSPDRRRAKSRGRSKSRPRSQSRSPDWSRARSRGHSRSRSPDRSRARSRGRSKSRPRSHSRSPDRTRARSRGRSKSRPRSHSRSPDRTRARSRGRSKSRPRSHSRSPDRSRARSRGRSKSRPRSHSRSPDRSRARSRGRSRSRSRGRSRGRIYSKAASRARSKSRQRSRSRSRSASSSSSSSSCSLDYSDEKSRKEFRELETARRRRELEEMLSLPTKSILKKRNDSEDSPLLRKADSVRALEGSNISQVADQLLLAVKGLEPHRVASMLSELQSNPQMAQRAGLDAEIKEILSLLGDQATGAKAEEKTVDDIDDEEKFLYGDSEEPKPPALSEPVRHHGLDLYGDVTEETLYGDYPPQTAIMPQAYGVPPAEPPNPQVLPTPEVDVRYVSRPIISPDQNITVQVSNPAYPPGTEPLEESERQALEEYEKIQDLLKTIGLDLGVAEISKMAARTKERLQGNRPPPKTPTRRRHYSSGSSDGSPCTRGGGRRTHSRSSSSSSRSRSCGSRGSWSCDNSCRKTSAPPRSYKDRDVKETKAERCDAGLPPQLKPEPNTLPSHPGVPIPTYPPSQVHSMVAPNFPPPGYGQYGNYLPYMHQQWPPMFPSPNMSLPPQGGPSDFPPALPCKGPYSKADPEPGTKGLGKSCVQDGEKGKASSCDRRSSEEQNNESQKQKVLEEREKLKQERDTRMKKKEYLMKELERLRKQQGELLRKKRREKGGHKDPLLQEISHLQEEVMTQISNLRKEHEVAEKKRNELDKVALILGLSPSDRPRRTSKPTVEQEAKPPPPSEKGKREPQRSPEGRQPASSSMIKTSVVLLPLRESPDKPPIISLAPPPAPPPDPFEYYDAGNHWCKNCNVTSGSMFDFFTHLHSKTHRKTLDPYDRPWASTPTKTVKNTMSEDKLTKPAKGSEFLLPVRGFFCLLCKEFYGDAICAEEHVTTHAHNEKYKKQMYENPLYEQRRNLDRQAGLASEMSGKKRKHEDDEKGNKDKEEKSKHKKDKKDKEKQKEETDTVQKEEKLKVKKEEEEKLKPGKKEDFKEARILDEDRPSHSKKDEDEKCKYSRKDDKYRYSREEEERAKYSRRDEEDRYKRSREEEYRYRYRREEDVRHDDRSKYGLREDEDKYKSSKNLDFTSKYEKERDEGKPKSEREAFKKLEVGNTVGKPEVSKPEPPTKPYNLPKIICGPSPAMRAKLRKQSLEAGKPSSVAMTASFGKFTWKKRENVLAKEAQEVAAEFIKDDEAAVKQNPVSVEDSFAKSVAVAKEIAQKLGGQQNMPLPLASDIANRGRIRPNLPAPAAVLRKTAMMGKPAPLNAFLSIRPQNTSLVESPPKDGPRFPGLNTTAQNAPLEAKPEPPIDRAGPSLPALATVTPKPFEPKPVTAVSKPKMETKPLVSGYQISPSVAKPAQTTMIKIVSDVAAPGVPESEQTHTVFVKPPPFLALGDGGQKSEKLKSNLAAAKAQELFGIFYSSVGQSGTSSITKPAADSRASSSTNKSHLPTLQTQNPQPQPLTESPPPSVVCTSPYPDANNPPIPQTHPESNIQIASVWSLQSTPAPISGVTPSRTTSQTTHLKQSPPPQSEAQSVHQNQSSFPKSESEIAPQMEPAELKQTPQTQPKLTPQNETEPQSEHQPDQDTQPLAHPETHPDAAPEPEPKPGPKTRGKTTPTKRNPADLRPVRQTRSQTRYQTRQQQSLSELEPEPASGDSDTVAFDPKGLDTSVPGSGMHPREGALSEGGPQVMVITPETLGVPSDMASLDFESDFNFE
uniref:zinc finger protein 318 isoform X2 n=1 Tax=Scatophagus argus TaxID=75038 RepID=UPI001ED7E87A|nr:zinc finger protein 318 isoform X2 [Scatophagus argus]